jgi:hypothetical protein
MADGGYESMKMTLTICKFTADRRPISMEWVRSPIAQVPALQADPLIEPIDVAGGSRLTLLGLYERMLANNLAEVVKDLRV